MCHFDRAATNQAKNAMAQTDTLSDFAIATFNHNLKTRKIDVYPAMLDAERQLETLIDAMKTEALAALQMAAFKAGK